MHIKVEKLNRASSYFSLDSLLETRAARNTKVRVDYHSKVNNGCGTTVYLFLVDLNSEGLIHFRCMLPSGSRRPTYY